MATWKLIKDYPKYMISDTGKIWSFYYSKEKIPRLRKDGYYDICLINENGKKWFYIHRLVLENFDKKCPENMECDHKDRDKSNNKISNLHWVNKKQNIKNRKFKNKKGSIQMRKNGRFRFIYYIKGVKKSKDFEYFYQAKICQKVYQGLAKHRDW